MGNYFTKITEKHVLVKAEKLADKCIKFEYDTGREVVIPSILWSTIKDTTSNNGMVHFYQSSKWSGMATYGQEVSPENPLILNDGSSDTTCTTIQQAVTWLLANLT